MTRPDPPEGYKYADTLNRGDETKQGVVVNCQVSKNFVSFDCGPYRYSHYRHPDDLVAMKPKPRRVWRQVVTFHEPPVLANPTDGSGRACRAPYNSTPPTYGPVEEGEE